MLQIFEWIAITYIIKSQQNRDVGQIMFDHTNENMAASVFDSSQIKFRKIEKLIKLSFQIFVFAFSIMFIVDAFLANT